MITGKNIVKKFDDLILFNNFNFKIDKGEFVCFSGVSGKGKTTLLNIIGLIENYDDGELIIDNVSNFTNKQKLNYYRNKVGFLFQNFALMDQKTVKENLEIVNRKCRTDYTIEEALEIVGLEDKLQNKVYTLSGGEQQRVGLARLFLKKCDIILADEPTGSLDYGNAVMVMELLKKLNCDGKTIIMVSHDKEFIKMADRVIEI